MKTTSLPIVENVDLNQLASVMGRAYSLVFTKAFIWYLSSSKQLKCCDKLVYHIVHLCLSLHLVSIIIDFTCLTNIKICLW